MPPSIYGVANPSTVRSLDDALASVTGGRHKLVFVNNGFTNGDIQKVIEQVAEPAQKHGDSVLTISSETDLQDTCRTTLRGTSSCIAAAVFYSSPTEGPGGLWNYSIRADGSLGDKINTEKSNNDQQIYILPFQHAIDQAIARTNGSGDNSLPSRVGHHQIHC